MIDLSNTNRSKCRIRCYYTINIEQTHTIVHGNKLSGVFYARFVNSQQTAEERYGNGFLSTNTFITIETFDNLENLINLKSSGVACKIKIPSMNKEYIINDVQVRYDNDSLELSNIRTSKKRTVLNLNEIRR